MVAKKRVPVEGVPDLEKDKTFVHLVVGLAQCGDPRTVKKFLKGESVGRPGLLRDAIVERLTEATKQAVRIRREGGGA